MYDHAMPSVAGSHWSGALSRNIGAALHGSMELEHAQHSGASLDETRLQATLLKVLMASPQLRGTHEIKQNHAVDALQSARNTGNKAGRYREVDFAAFPYSQPANLSLAIELKYASSSHANWENIIIDLCRLAIINRAHPDAICFFVLAGKRVDVEKKLAHKHLNKPSSGGRRLLPFPSPEGSIGRYPLFNGPHGAGIFSPSLNKKISKSLPAVPTDILTCLYKPGYVRSKDPIGTKYFQEWDALVWKIEACRAKICR